MSNCSAAARASLASWRASRTPFPSRRSIAARAIRVTLGIRPEAIVLSHAGDPQAIPVVVDVIETLGAEQYVFLRFDDGGQLARGFQAMSTYAGQRLFARLQPEKIHLFDQPSGLRRAPQRTPAPATV